MLTFIYDPKCAVCKKAKIFLDDIGAVYTTRDIKTEPPKYDEMKLWLIIGKFLVNKLFNASSQLYKSLNLKEWLPLMSEDECLHLLASDGMLVKRPLLTDNEYHILVGFQHDEWLSLFTEYDRNKLDAIFQDYFDEMLRKVSKP